MNALFIPPVLYQKGFIEEVILKLILRPMLSRTRGHARQNEDVVVFILLKVSNTLVQLELSMHR
jgi:hypothetical protein